MDRHNGWTFLIPFVLFAVLFLLYRLTQDDPKAGHNDRDVDCRYWWGDRSGSSVGVTNETCSICNPPKAASTPRPRHLRMADPLYDWAADDDFKRATVAVKSDDGLNPHDGFAYASECELGCVWVFIGKTQQHAESLRQDHYEEVHGHDYNMGS